MGGSQGGSRTRLWEAQYGRGRGVAGMVRIAGGGGEEGGSRGVLSESEALALVGFLQRVAERVQLVVEGLDLQILQLCPSRRDREGEGARKGGEREGEGARGGGRG
jgi:hypothetical protein